MTSQISLSPTEAGVGGLTLTLPFPLSCTKQVRKKQTISLLNPISTVSKFVKKTAGMERHQTAILEEHLLVPASRCYTRLGPKEPDSVPLSSTNPVNK